jgi:hypothetical protein
MKINQCPLLQRTWSAYYIDIYISVLTQQEPLKAGTNLEMSSVCNIY